MNRVWKRFLYKVGYASLLVLYILLAILLPELFFVLVLEQDLGMGTFVGSVVFLVIPAIGLLLRDVYRDSKREVELENRDMMRNLGKKY